MKMLIPLNYWCGKRTFDSPMVGNEPGVQDGPANTQSACPLRNVQCFATEGYIAIGPPVIGLFFGCCPLTIFRGIVAVIVDAFNAIPVQYVTHISIKSFKRINPTVAHFYSAAAIAFIFCIVWIATSGFHGSPSTVNLGPAFNALLFAHTLTVPCAVVALY